MSAPNGTPSNGGAGGPGGWGHDEGGDDSRRPNRSDKSRPRSQPQRGETPPITPDTKVSLSEAGRAFFNQLLEAASVEAGRKMSAEDMLEVMRRVRANLGTDDVNFNIDSHMECLKKHVHAIGKEPPMPPRGGRPRS